MLLKSSPSGFKIPTVLRSGLSSGSFSLSNTFGLSKEYVMPWENPQNSATSLATSSTRSLYDNFPVVASPDGSVTGILS